MNMRNKLVMGISATLLVTTAGLAMAAPCKGPGMYPGMKPGYGYGPMTGPYGPRYPMWGGPRYQPGPVMPHSRPGSAAPGSQSASAAGATTAGPGTAGAKIASDDAAAETAVVSIAGMQFNPPRVVVKKGATVSWKQGDGMPHTVTANDGGFGSSRLSAGGEFSHTFDKVGAHSYYCALHPSMRGEVVVVE